MRAIENGVNGVSVTDGNCGAEETIKNGNTTQALLDDLEARGYKLWVGENGRLQYEGPAITPVIWHALQANYGKLVRLLSEDVTGVKNGTGPLYESRNGKEESARARLIKTRDLHRIDGGLLPAAREEAKRQRAAAGASVGKGADFLDYLKALGDHRDLTEREAFERAEEALETGELCGQCGRDIGREEPVCVGWNVYTGIAALVGQPHFTRTAVCVDCLVGASKKRKVEQTHACCKCGRLVCPSWRQSRSRYVMCSERCRRQFHNERHSHRRRVRNARYRNKTCEVCNTPFTAPRVDAKTCSKACKQKAYRQRKNGGAA